MKSFKLQLVLLTMAASILVLQLYGSVNHAAEGATRYQYKVIRVQGMTELRTQSDADEGRVPAIENIIQQQASAGWEFYQADGYLLYFRR